ncbi:MAG: bifunctional phosphoribosyl-AMP cyclohydrolase/phosphoribosyl-ATP diphosphatase HisIE [Candidatus Peribacteraceae bacterium]|nr:bifunctional phosphoribosyl-AMP cyclohydrolase/phosphoribosyl-ATP diphosphatase HisIE [Candidatus Peribacteraceae bacterium]
MDTSTLDWQKNPDGLLPVVVQDCDTAQVLMLGYMNQEALEQTLQTKLVTFYSRSKGRLWQKGEASGNVLQFVSISPDCDRDCLLIRAKPKGPTCHTGKKSCFGDDELPLETIGQLIRTIAERASGGDCTSYTKQLLDGGVDACGAKVLEEAEEVVRAAKQEGKQRTTEEAVDLLYHLLVLLENQNIGLSDISAELRKRRR